ncbi:hypothetical protein ANCDUO_20242 [Ancylostoma duodenale]|uniref:Uncharacterized protein n=1 Tax=Ancylostoma duodenale TaxID=51022 RepID=A0A0C2CIS1_9BILA|nr:hypothetical protein ANCDUO_20242 [Ancylostoma duodenale]
MLFQIVKELHPIYTASSRFGNLLLLLPTITVSHLRHRYPLLIYSFLYLAVLQVCSYCSSIQSRVCTNFLDNLYGSAR